MEFWPIHLIPDLETAKKEARTLLCELLRNGVPERYQQFGAIDVLPARLTDAQYLVARRYGFRSWAALKKQRTKAVAA